MSDEQGSREAFFDLSQARIAPYKNIWKPLQDTVCWCNLLPAQERSDAVVLYDTLQFIEKAICMKTKEQFYHGESAGPCVVLTANSQC